MQMKYVVYMYMYIYTFSCDIILKILKNSDRFVYKRIKRDSNMI